MREDALLFLVVFAIWIALAVVYATVPLFAMPGYATVWGWGSLVFLALAGLTIFARRRGKSRSRRGPDRDDTSGAVYER